MEPDDALEVFSSDDWDLSSGYGAICLICGVLVPRLPGWGQRHLEWHRGLDGR